MLCLPPPLSSRVHLAAAARRRGFSVMLIAAGLGVSHQAVQQLIARHSQYHGSAFCAPVRRGTRVRYARSLAKCQHCGARFERSIAAVNGGRAGIRYCSHNCQSLGERILTREDILFAIHQRQAHKHTWGGIANSFKLPVQTVQNSIWRYLIEENLLTKDTVASIWMPSKAVNKGGRWGWLARRYGVEPR